MAKRADLFSEERLASLYTHHPYLLLFQKEDWKEYLHIYAQLYDLLEEENVRVPFEVIRSFVIKFYGPKQLLNLEQKVHHFFVMSIGELQILKDSHDQFGQRYLEATRSGKMLLQMADNLLAERTKFSGTGAESLLGALNDLLVSRKQMTEEEAIQHHRQKIKAYQEDILKIKRDGIAHAELLPIAHSAEALFAQAEEAAIHILASIEDVKTAIENQRQDLAQNYFNNTRSAGQNLNAVAEFYEKLFSSPEYASYDQAKNLLSYLDHFSHRFPVKNVDHLLHQIAQNGLVSSEEVKRSQLRWFMNQFQSADRSIQEKVQAQIKLLQQQVCYATSTDVHGLQASLHQTVSLMLSKKEHLSSYFEHDPVQVKIASEFDIGTVLISDFDVPVELPGDPILSSHLEENEHASLLEALLRAEETTLQQILERIRQYLAKNQTLELSQFEFRYGLAEYYVLSEIEVFETGIAKTLHGTIDLVVPTKFDTIVLRNISNCSFSLRENYAVQ